MTASLLDGAIEVTVELRQTIEKILSDVRILSAIHKKTVHSIKNLH